MRIALLPTSFKFVNRTWRVKACTWEEMAWAAYECGHNPDEPLRGLCDAYNAIIYLNLDRHTCHDDLVHTFWHEVGHAYLFATGRFDHKSHDEKSVDQFGALMAQLWSTCQGELHI